MKTALIAGVFLLVLTFTIADALDKKQDNCDPNSDALQACETAATNFDRNALCGDCRSTLTDYFNDCLGGAGVDELNREFSQVCGSAAIVVSLFTIVSALLVALIGKWTVTL